MRVIHIVPAFYPAFYYGGPTHSLYALCNALARHRVEVRVLTTDTAGPRMRVPVCGFPMMAEAGYAVYYCRRACCVSMAPGILWHLIRLVQWADLVHLTAVYSFPTIPCLLTAKLLGKPVVWSPRGALQRWEGSTRLTLKALWEGICRAVAPKALVLHVTSKEEEQESRERFPGVETTIIPNGIEIPEHPTHIARNGILRLSYLGRLHPKKGIENLLAACRILRDDRKVDFSLTLAGGGEPSYSGALRARIEQLGLSRLVHMAGELSGEAKRSLFEETDIGVIPSYTENFGMVVAETLAHSVPVIASTGTPWQRVEEMGCGLWVNNTPQELADAVERMSRMPLQEMGRRGLKWMQQEFGWDGRAQQMIGCYKAILRRDVGHAL